MARIDRYNKNEEINEKSEDILEELAEEDDPADGTAPEEPSAGDEQETGTEEQEDDGPDEPAKRKKKRGKAGKVFLVILLLLLAAGGYEGYRYLNATTFPTGVRVNGVDVGTADVPEAVKRISADANHVTIVHEGEKLAELDAAYTYDIAPEVEQTMRIANIDPRAIFRMGVDYEVPILVNGGTEESADLIKEALPNPSGTVYSKDAYVDYENIKVVKEVTGNNIDYMALSKAIADFKTSGPYGEPFDFDPTKYVDAPDVREEDLTAELDFAKKYIAEGLVLRSGAGNELKLTTAQMAKVISYSPDGPVYSEEGARKVAEEISGDYEPWQLTIDTQEGPRTLNNYVLPGSIDVEKTGESIYQALSSGEKTAVLYTVEPDVITLDDHVEVSITNQKLYTVQNGKVTHTIDVITGRPGWETVPGIFNVYNMARDVTLVGTEDDYYECKVEYWMPFDGGAGMHDATWHSVFGGEIYKTERGSHGCVGMSLEDAATVYDIVDIGYPVVIYY